MTDYTKSTGSSGTMMIRDTGTNVELWIIAGSQTWINGATYGGSWSGTFNYPSGGAWLKIRTVDVNNNMTVTFTLNATGTSGLGGPTTLSAAITRVVVPDAPDPVTFSSITTTSVFTTFTGNGYGGETPTWQLARNTSNTTTGATIVASDGTLSVTGLAKGDVYYFWARGHNSAGYGPWSSVRSMTTLAIPPAPDAVVLSAITNVGMHTVFTSNGNGVGTFIRWELGFGTSSATPATIVTSPGGILDIGSLAPGTTYYFWARGINTTGTGPWSARSTAKTLNVPDAPNAVVLSEIKQTALKTVFAGNGTGGSTVLEWQIGYGIDPVTPQLSYSGFNTTLTGLDAGKVYYFWSRGRNVYGWGPYSARSTATLLAGAWVDVDGVKKRAVPYVRDAGVWKVAESYAKIAGLWKGAE